MFPAGTCERATIKNATQMAKYFRLESNSGNDALLL